MEVVLANLGYLKKEYLSRRVGKLKRSKSKSKKYHSYKQKDLYPDVQIPPSVTRRSLIAITIPVLIGMFFHVLISCYISTVAARVRSAIIFLINRSLGAGLRF